MSAKPFLTPTPGMFIQEDWFEGADSFLDLVKKCAGFEYSPTAWTRSRTGGGNNSSVNDHRSSVESDLNAIRGVINEPEPEFESLRVAFTQFHEILDRLINNFRRSYDLHLTQDEGFRVIRYQNKAEYRIHHDHIAENSRVLSFVCFLNDDFEGGQLEFPLQKITVEPKAGSVVVFPSNFPFAHIAHPVMEGTKYSLVTWFK